MFENNERKELRQFYFDVWQKYQQKQTLEPLEQQLISIILQHPEYHEIFTDPEKILAHDYLAEAGNSNPFLHLSLHQALLEQVATNRPAGITAIYQKLIQQIGEVHSAEHAMMEILAETLWEGMRQGKFVDDQTYLAKLQRLI